MFHPKKQLPYGAKVTVSVDRTARSAAGADVGGTTRARFRVVPEAGGRRVGIPTGAAGAVNGSWLAVEQYYLRLMNCTRTGGWVTSSGACSGPGGRDVAAARAQLVDLRPGLAALRPAPRDPWRVQTTSSAATPVTASGPPASDGYNWGENIGCRRGNPYASVLGDAPVLPVARGRTTAATTGTS